MLTCEDREVLGMAPESGISRRPSAVSQALRAIAAEIDETGSWRLPDQGDGRRDFRVRVAVDRATRERAYRLAYNVYREKGYAPPQEKCLAVAEYDAAPQTLTVLAEDAAGHAAGTVTLVLDSSAGLPCDEIYGAEVNLLRTHGRRLLEVTRLAIGQPHSHSKALLTLLCNIPFAYGMRAAACTDLLIEVNPRHVAYYVKLLKFVVLGPERACPRVRGAPAVLLRSDLGAYAEEMKRIGGLGAACTDRSLFPHFYAGAEEWEFARFLACQHKPMPRGDAQYFGLASHTATTAMGN